MTVAELIAELQKLEPGMRVVVRGEQGVDTAICCNADVVVWDDCRTYELDDVGYDVTQEAFDALEKVVVLWP